MKKARGGVSDRGEGRDRREGRANGWVGCHRMRLEQPDGTAEHKRRGKG